MREKFDNIRNHKLFDENNRDRTFVLALLAFGVLALLVQAWIPIQITGGIFFIAFIGLIVWLVATDEFPAAPVVSRPTEVYNPKAPGEVAEAWSNLPEQQDATNSGRPLLTPAQVENVKSVIRERHANRRVNDTI